MAAVSVSNKGFFQSLRDNWSHTGPIAFYATLGAATGSSEGFNLPINVLGLQHVPQLNPLWSGVFFAVNTYARWDQTSKVLNSNVDSFKSDVSAQHLVAQEHHKLIAENIVNAGVTLASYALTVGAPGVAGPVIGAIIGMDFFVAGENSPIEIAKSNIAGALDSILGDHF